MSLTTVVTAAALAILLFLGTLESLVHRKRLLKIPLRIHVNGSRGKTSVVRMTAAVLREAGFRVIARTTGTIPLHILEDGSEVLIKRRGIARIIEYRGTIKIASDRGADAVVIECMALNPGYQKIAERRLVRSTHGVITNIRNDHLDVMGPDLEDVAGAVSSTIPEHGCLFTSEKKFLPFLRERAFKRSTEVIFCDPSVVSDTVPGEDRLFDFNENSALVLGLCRRLGISGDIAARAMRRFVPDPGAVAEYTVATGAGVVHTVDAFSVNDPTSAEAVLRRLNACGLLSGNLVMIYNNRIDRMQRGLGFIPFLRTCDGEYGIAKLVMIGPGTKPMSRLLLKRGFPAEKIIGRRKIGNGEMFMKEVTEWGLSDRVTGAVGPSVTVLGIGNSAGEARALTAYWKTIGVRHV